MTNSPNASRPAGPEPERARSAAGSPDAAPSDTASSGSGRLDVELVRRGLVRSRGAAVELIEQGRVLADGRLATKPSLRVPVGMPLEVDDPGWVSRAAAKLDRGLDVFRIDPAGRFALDVGASTGGFTQVLLRRGVRRVVSIDVGHDQLAASVRADARVHAVEGLNVRDLDATSWPEVAGTLEHPSLVVADVSFISLRLVLPAVVAVLAQGGDIVALIKPQFEVGRGGVRGGVVRDTNRRAEAVAGVLAAAWDLGLGTRGLIRSPIVGEHGNIEAVAWLTAGAGAHPTEWSAQIDDVSDGSTA